MLQSTTQVTLVEKGQQIASSVREWGHVQLFSPWSLNMSDVGREILDEMGYPIPSCDSFPSGHQFISEYLDVLGAWLQNSGNCTLLTNSEAIAIGRGTAI
jgi:hypothetical protein